MNEQDRIAAIKNNGGEHLKAFKESNITYGMCLAAVQSMGRAIDFVPLKYRTEEVFQEACKSDGMALNRVPVEFMTQKICEYAIASNGLALQYVPGKYLSEELCKKAAIQSAQAYKYIPSEFISATFVVDVAQKSKYESINCLPDQFKKNSFYFDLICLDPEFIWVIPRKALTAKIGKAAIKGMKYISSAEAVRARPELLSRLHTSLYDHETCLAFVESEYFRQSNGNSKCGFNTQEDEKNGRLYLADKFTETYSLPDMMKWPDVVIPILMINGYYISYAQSDILTEEMCKIAIESNPYSFEYIPLHLRTKEICMFAFDREPILIEYFPEEFVTYELALKAVKHSGYTLEYIPKQFRTKEVCLIAVSDEGDAEIEEIPESVLDKEILLAYFKNTRYAVGDLEKVPKGLLDYDVCFAAVQKSGYNLQYVPHEYWDYKMCFAAIQDNPSAARTLPEELFTEKLALAVVSIGIYEFQHLPKRCLTEAVCLAALKRADKYVGDILKAIPKEILTQEMCDISVEKYPQSIKDVPEQFVTESILLTVARKAHIIVKYHFPERLRTKAFIKRLIEEEPLIEPYLADIVPID